jgi:hypothetical protein
MNSISIVGRGAALLIAVAISAAGCDSGYDEEDSQAICNGLIGNVQTAPSGLYAECVACFMDCGDECAIAESDPPQFNCPE